MICHGIHLYKSNGFFMSKDYLIIVKIIMLLVFSTVFADTLDNITESAPIMCSDNQEKDSFLSSQKSDLFTPVIESSSFYINANRISGSKEEAHYASGNVQAYKDNQSILSDWLYLQQDEYNHMQAGDHFIFTRQYDVISGEYFDYYFDLNKGTIKNGEVFYKKKNITIKSKKMLIHDRKHFDVFNGIFTSCKADDPSWYISAESMNFDYQKSEAAGNYGTLYFESVPLIKSKNIFFPLGERKSGWLRPTIGSTKNNAHVDIPFYWNQAPNYDNTITPKIWTLSGLMVADEQRYLIDHGWGNWYTEQVPFDFTMEKYRWFYNINGTEINNHDNDVSLEYKYKQVSDQNYFLSFGDYDAVTKNVDLEQSVSVTAKENWGNSNIIVQNYQIIVPQGYNTPAPVYSRLPQLSYNSAKPNIGGFQFGLNTNYTYFLNQQQNNGKQNAQRLFLYPSLAYPLENQWGFIKPEVDGFLDYYQIYNNDYVHQTGGDATIQTPVFSIDSGLKFDNDYDQIHLSQTFEPRLLYVYIPAVEQGNVPVYDTSTATYNYNQLFTPLGFAGYDRVNQANNLTYGFTSRFMNDVSNSQFASLAVAYEEFFFNSNTTIYGNPQTYSQLYLPQPNFIIEATGNPNKHHNVSAGLQIDTTERNPASKNIDNFSFGYQFIPEDYKVLNAKFNYQYHLPLLYYNQVAGQAFNGNYEDQYAIDLSGQWPIYKDKILIGARDFYDLTARRNMNILGGITYNGGCWATSLVGQQYVIDLTHNGWAVMLELELNQIGKLSTSTALDNSLKNNIPGYKEL
jgi:LPS-assembly protein